MKCKIKAAAQNINKIDNNQFLINPTSDSSSLDEYIVDLIKSFNYQVFQLMVAECFWKKLITNNI